MNILLSMWRGLISLKFAVSVMVMLTLSLIAATLIESNVDTKTAQYYVYRTWWFYLLLALLGALILAVALSRYPWKKKHIPFLMAHAGILMILGGSWLTYTNGIDGSIRLTEDEVNSAVELDEQVLVFKKGDAVETIPLPWIPESVAQSRPSQVYPSFGVRLDRFVPDAVAQFQFDPVEGQSSEKTGSAIQIRILGAPMGGAPEVWLWNGDPAWSTQKMGPARFLIRDEDVSLPLDLLPEARLEFVVSKKGGLSFESISPRGEIKKSQIVFKGEDPVMVNPGWRMPIQIQVKKFIPRAVNHTRFEPAKIKSDAPMPAISISLIDHPDSKMWLALGDRAEFAHTHDEKISVGFFQKRIILPFALRLNEFIMKNNPGTFDPASYASRVQVVDGMQKNQREMDALPVHTIQMNEPLKFQRYTFYQASYIPDFPKITTSVLSVNYDPGRLLKYLGSLLLVAGSILLYWVKVMSRRKVEVSI